MSIPTQTAPLCDPGGGFPKARPECPDTNPDTGWLEQAGTKGLWLKPFHTLGNDAQGQLYAKRHDLEFPFPNDYFDAATGPAQQLALDPATACTGILMVGYREPLSDHLVPCDALVRAAAQRRIPVAVWRTDQAVVQISELYRP